MDRNMTIGLVLIGIVLTVFTVINQPSQEDIQKAKLEQETAKQKSKEPQQARTETMVAEKSKERILSNQVTNNLDTPQAPVKKLSLENDHLKVNITTKGAQIASVYLKKYHSYDDFVDQKDRALCLFSDKDGENYLAIPGIPSTKNLVFNAETTKNAVTLTGNIDDQRKIVVEYALKEDHRLNYSIHLEGFSQDQQDRAQLKWYLNMKRTERKLSEQRKTTTICYQEKEEGMDYLSETSDD